MKRKLLIFLVTLFIMGTSCTKKDISLLPESKQVKAPSQITFAEHNLYPEGLAFDPLHNMFLVSSAAMGTVGSVTFDSVYTPLITDENLMMTTGLKVDRSRQRVLVCNVGTGLGSYDLTSGKRLFFSDFTSLLPTEPVFINDETFDPEGNVYATNSVSPVIYKVDRNGKASIFFQDVAFSTGPPDFGFNGIQFCEKGFILVTHTALNQLIKIPLNDPSKYSVVQLDKSLVLPDGLLLSKDGMQVVVVSFDHVLSYTSNDGWKSGQMSTSFSVGNNYPTSLTSDGKRVFVLYSPLDLLMSGMDHDSYTINEVLLKKTDTF